MAYQRIIKRESGARYYYIMRSVRKGRKVESRIAEYLGESPDPERLRRACEYWKFKMKGAMRKATRTRR